MAARGLEKELVEYKHQAAVEKSMRIAAEERLIEEHRNAARLEQTTSTKIDVSQSSPIPKRSLHMLVPPFKRFFPL
jgi:hypothetical protein